MWERQECSFRVTYEPVDVRVHDQRSAPVPGALIRVYDSEGGVFFTEGTTDKSGRAGFLLETARYSLRFHRALTRIDQPRAIEVVEGGDNAFNVEALELSSHTPSSPGLCRVTGVIRASNGEPIRGAVVRHTPLFDALSADDGTVIATLGRTAANERGEVDFELYQGARYRLEVDAPNPVTRELTVPEQRSHALLSGLLFPVPEYAAVGPDATISLDAGSAITLTPKVWSEAGEVLANLGRSFVTWSTTDTDVALVRASGPYLVVQGVAPGVSEIVATRARVEPPAVVTGSPVRVVVR